VHVQSYITASGSDFGSTLPCAGRGFVNDVRAYTEACPRHEYVHSFPRVHFFYECYTFIKCLSEAKDGWSLGRTMHTVVLALTVLITLCQEVLYSNRRLLSGATLQGFSEKFGTSSN
jgi:hypothetical protein